LRLHPLDSGVVERRVNGLTDEDREVVAFTREVAREVGLAATEDVGLWGSSRREYAPSACATSMVSECQTQ